MVDLLRYLNGALFANQLSRVARVELICSGGSLKSLMSAARAAGNLYLVLLDQRFYLKNSSPKGPADLSNELILVSLQMETRGVRVVQLEDISRDGEWLHLSLVSLAGETQSFVLHENDTWSALREQCSCFGAHVVLPSGTLAGHELDDIRVQDLCA
ncbi:unnamed protein product [Effrenium voratum]|nr:unnamed protein product [Effrenium voratum]